MAFPENLKFNVFAKKVGTNPHYSHLFRWPFNQTATDCCNACTMTTCPLQTTAQSNVHFKNVQVRFLGTFMATINVIWLIKGKQIW